MSITIFSSRTAGPFAQYSSTCAPELDSNVVLFFHTWFETASVQPDGRLAALEGSGIRRVEFGVDPSKDNA